MGCRQSASNKKVQAEENHRDGLQSDKKEFDALPALDPRLPLDARGTYKLKISWKGIKRNMESTGVEMFVRLFKTNAELKELFSGFKHLEADELRANEVMENHATMVMSTLDEAISNIDNYTLLEDLLTKTGASHIRFVGFKKENFMLIKEPFLEAVKITLGDRYTDQVESVYSQAITFILQKLTEGIEDAQPA